MSGSPDWALQQAIYTRLSGDSTLVTTLGCDVYDDTPQDAAYPYVVIDQTTEVPNDTMGTTSRNTVVTLHTWDAPDPTASTQVKGAKRVKQIHNRLSELLDRWAPTVTGWGATQMQFEFSDIMRDPDGITRHGVTRFRIYLTEE